MDIIIILLCFQLKFPQNDRGIWWRNLPTIQRCELSALGIPPGTIEADLIELQCQPPLSLTVVPEIGTQFVLTLGLRWEPPDPLNGGNLYEITISDRHIENDGSGITNPLRYVVQVNNIS